MAPPYTDTDASNPALNDPAEGVAHGAVLLGSYRVLSTILLLAVLVQAALAGQFLNGSSDLVAVHRVLAEGIPIVALGLLGVAWVRHRSTATAVRPLLNAVAIVVAVVVQTGLGFAGRDSTMAAALHVPLGVGLFGLTAYALTLTKPDPQKLDVGR